MASVLHPFKMQLIRDLEKYQKIVIRNQNNGKLGGRPKKKKPRKSHNVKDSVKDSVKDNESDDIKNIIVFLNDKAKTKYRPDTKSTIKLIKARFKEKYTVEDFKIVINKKTKEWMGSEMNQYLRPKTLFGDNFESYLNQPEFTNRSALLNGQQRLPDYYVDRTPK